MPKIVAIHDLTTEQQQKSGISPLTTSAGYESERAYAKHRSGCRNHDWLVTLRTGGYIVCGQ